VIGFSTMRPAPRAGAIAVVAGLLIAVIAVGYLQASALAVPSAPGPARLPAPVIVQYPANPTYATTALFTFTDADWPDVTFHCYLGEPPARPCTRSSAPPARHRIGKPRKVNKSKKRKHHKHRTARHHHGRRHKPTSNRRDISVGRVEGEQRYSGLTIGLYCFFVYATDKAGARSRTSQYCWEVQGHPPPYPPPHPRPPHPSPSLLGLTVGGNLSTPLFPGASESLDLTFTNPNSVPLTIPSGNLAASNITVTSTQAGCPNSDFEVVQGLTASVTIPAGQVTPISLADLSIPAGDWPVIEMVETGTNQDACEGAPLTLTYSGIEATG
jgi:hypothetical protein